MVKRSFWLLVAALGAWLLWQWMQQRNDEMIDRSPQFAPPRPFVPPAASVPADDDQVAAVTVPPPVPSAPPAPPAPAADAAIDALFAPADDDQVGAPPEPPSDAALDALFAPAEEQPAVPAETRAAEFADAVAAALEEADAPPAAPPASSPDTHGIAAGTGAGTPIGEEVLGYCVRCRAKRPMQNPHAEFSESGRRAARGTCPVCGATMFTFLAASDDEQGASA